MDDSTDHARNTGKQCMNATSAVPLIVLIALFGVDGWVFSDARDHVRAVSRLSSRPALPG
jgi:hypothetical protein